MDCKRARELVENHLKFLATMEGEKTAKKAEILKAFSHVKKCSDQSCCLIWHAILWTSRECSFILASPSEPSVINDGSFGCNGDH